MVAPATVEDAYGMLGPALADPDPVVIFEHVQLYNTSADVEALTPTDIPGSGPPQRDRRHPGGLRRLPLEGARRR